MSLPLKAKVAIRDFWEKKDAAASKAREELQALLGLDVLCNPEWPILTAELEKVYEDKGQLVMSIISCLEAWFKSLNTVLDNPAHEEFAEKLLDRIKEKTAYLKLGVEVSINDNIRTTWSDATASFTLQVPRVEMYRYAQYHMILQEQILSSLDPPKAKPSLAHRVATEDDDWADLTLEQTKHDQKVAAEQSSHLRALTDQASRQSSKMEYLPDPKSLPQPGLLTSQPPYFMIIRAPSISKVRVECSHGPTLEFLAEYLKRWCRTNPNIVDKPQMLKVELNYSSSCFAAYDALSIDAEVRYGMAPEVSATLILHLVEGVLGYDRIWAEHCTWHYRRSLPFKK